MGGRFCAAARGLPPFTRQKIDGDEVKKTAFRIAGKIDIEAVKSRPRPTKPGDGRFRTWNPKYASASPAVSPVLRPALVIGAEAATV